MYIQINVPEDLSKKIKIEKIQRDIGTQAEVVVVLLQEYFSKRDGII